MSYVLDIDLIKVTEAAALASHQWVGRGNKNVADQAAVSAMRHALNQMPITGEVVIGEGEIDEAPMLYIGEKVGMGGVEVDIAVDPIEGTRMTALGQANALSVIAIAKKGQFLKAPDMYMEKLLVNKSAKGVIDIDLPLEDNLQRIAQQLNKPFEKLSVAIIHKPRHEALIDKLQKMGIKVLAFPDGDVIVSAEVCKLDSKIDVMYGIGGAPEGVISAAVVKALGGDMQAKLLPRYVVKGDGKTLCSISEQEISRCKKMGVEVNTPLHLDQIVRADGVLFAASGITTGEMLKGIEEKGDAIIVNSLLISSENPKFSITQSEYFIE